MLRILVYIFILVNTLGTYAQTFTEAEELNFNFKFSSLQFKKTDNEANTYYGLTFIDSLKINATTYKPFCSPGQSSYGSCGQDILIIKVNSLKVIQWIYQLGSIDDAGTWDDITAFHVDSLRNIYVAANLSEHKLKAGGTEYPSMPSCLVIISPDGKTKKIQSLGGYVYNVITDKNLNLYMTGSVSDEVEKIINDPGTGISPYGKNTNAFVIKLDSSMNTKWINTSILIKSRFSTNLRVFGTKFVQDNTGKLFLLSDLYSDYNDTLYTVNFDNFSYQSKLRPFVNETLILEVDKVDGKFKALFPGFNSLRGACFDNENNLVVWGNGEVKNNVVQLKYSGSYLIKFKDFSYLIWQKQIPGEAYFMVTNELGDLFITGEFTDYISFEPNINLTTPGKSQYLAKVESNSKVQWATKMPDTYNFLMPLKYLNDGQTEYLGRISSTKVFGNYIVTPKATGIVRLVIKDNKVIAGFSDQDKEENILISVYPNPGDGKVNIQSRGGMIQELTINDLSGHLLTSVKPDSNNYSLDYSLPKGNFVMMIKIESKTYLQILSVVR